jgi:hypothetical protein
MLLYAVTKSRRVRGSALPLRFRGGSDGSVQSSRWDEAIFLMIPGTSCLATIVLSLRDKTIRPSKRLAIILALVALRAAEIQARDRVGKTIA